MARLILDVNGVARAVGVDPEAPLLWIDLP